MAKTTKTTKTKKTKTAVSEETVAVKPLTHTDEADATGVKQQAVLDVEVKTKTGQDPYETVKQEEQLIEAHVFRTQPAVVSARMGVTLNLGNFRSARIEVGLSYPCYREQVAETYELVRDFVDARVEAEVKAVHEAEQAAAQKHEAYKSAWENSSGKPSTTSQKDDYIF